MADAPPGVDAWKEHTSAFDRVRSIAETTSQPSAAADIATAAYVAENTARDHLERLVDMNVLLKRDRDGTTVYSPDPLHTRMQTLRDLLDAHSHDELVQLKADMQSRIESWREEYAVGSPTELRERAAEASTEAATAEIRQAANDWDVLRYRLDIVDDAIENYATYSRDDRAFA